MEEKLEKIKKWTTSDGMFTGDIVCSRYEECLELTMFNYQGWWYIVAKDEKNDSFVKDERLEEKILPLFEEILAFENPKIEYHLLYIAKKIHKLQFTKHYHLDNDVDFDILIKDSTIDGKHVKGMLDIQLNIMGDVTTISALKSALKSLPYVFKGIVVHNKKTNERVFFLNENFKSVKNIISKQNIRESVYDLFRRMELTLFLEDYPEFKPDIDKIVNSEIKPVINWLQIAYKRGLKLTSENPELQKIYNFGNISTFLKYEFKNIGYSMFIEMIKDFLKFEMESENAK